jgi:hypothetical protein
MNLNLGMDGVVDKFRCSYATQKNRIELCKTCDRFNSVLRMCKECGCLMDAKTWMADQECPIGRWQKVDSLFDMKKNNPIT